MSKTELFIVVTLILLLFGGLIAVTRNIETEFTSKGCHEETRERFHRGSVREVYVWKCPNDPKEYPSTRIK